MSTFDTVQHLQNKAARYRDESRSALQEAAELQQEAIGLLLFERGEIDKRLVQLGYGQEKAANGKRRGRPAKAVEQLSPLDNSSEAPK